MERNFGLNSFGSGLGFVVGFCELDNEPSGFMKDEKYLELLRDC
jgi:hypothetical protein